MGSDITAFKNAIPIIDYVDKYYHNIIPFTDRCNQYASAHCIWHEDINSPSLKFFAKTNKFKCFGCGKEGDLIDLVQHIEKVPFKEACMIISSNTGVPIRFEPVNPHHEAYKEAMDEHTRRYWRNYQNSYQARQYMEEERGFNKNTLDLYRIGLTDAQEYKIRNDIGNISNRITFPILEPKAYNAKCIGIAYRGLGNESPKYVNDMNQDGRQGQDQNLSGIFIKGNCLFGYAQAYSRIRDFNHIILVEGYTDVLSLYQSGIKNAVAIMGTQLTEKQAQLIKNVTDNAILIMDGDTAGRLAAAKILKTLFRYGICSKIVLLDGTDPADLCLKYKFNGQAVFNIFKKTVTDSCEFIVSSLVAGYENTVSVERRKALSAAAEFMDIMDGNELMLFKNSLYKRLDMR